MILTCPACDTKYVVKDDAIPPGGRQVRCASCKHSWHQDPEPEAAQPGGADIESVGSPPPDAVEEPSAEAVLPDETEERAAAQSNEESPWGAVSAEPAGLTMPPVDSDRNEDIAIEEEASVADNRRVPHEAEEEIGDGIVAGEEVLTGDEEFVSYDPIANQDGREKRRWPLILAILVLIIASAAAFWFLAPDEWKAKAGIAQAGATPLQLKITNADRQPLESGNVLVAISGQVINPTAREQNVPPIRAELRDKQTRRIVHSWTIAPPTRVLAPLSSASFNSAEMGVPRDGDELTVTLGS